MEDQRHERTKNSPIPVSPDENEPNASTNDDIECNHGQHVSNFMTGMRLHLLMLAVCLSVFLVNFEISVVSTSVISITNDLEEFGRSSWIVTAYLLTYAGCIVIAAKLSDIFGRKTVIMSSVAVFTIASGACGAAQSMTQLIVFRVFQGLGASGVYSLSGVVIFEMVPPGKYPRYAAYVAALFSISLFSGPLIGGLINLHTTWRWAFLLNVPAGTTGFVMLAIFLPRNFPYHDQPKENHKSGLWDIDLVGAVCMLIGFTLLIVAFEEASNFSSWVSANFLIPFLISIPTLLFFLFYERSVTAREGKGRSEPVLPWRFFKSRVIGTLLLNSFLVGGVFTTCIIQIPARFQVVNGESSWKAGVHLVPLGAAAPVGVGLTAALCKKRIPPVYLLFAASIFQVLGLVFMSIIPIESQDWKGLYGLQVLVGLGCGMIMGVTQLAMPFVIEQRDLATSTSAVVQLRTLGGVILLAIVTGAMNNHLKTVLVSVLPPAEIAHIFQDIGTVRGLGSAERTIVEQTFLKAYNTQLRILVGIAAAEMPAALLMWQKEQVKIK